jgi:hypothetical protein
MGLSIGVSASAAFGRSRAALCRLDPLEQPPFLTVAERPESLGPRTIGIFEILA